jgi:hypothetical protein
MWRPCPSVFELASVANSSSDVHEIRYERPFPKSCGGSASFMKIDLVTAKLQLPTCVNIFVPVISMFIV